MQSNRHSKKNPRLFGPSLTHEEILLFLSTIMACSLPFLSCTSISKVFDSTSKLLPFKLFRDPEQKMISTPSLTRRFYRFPPSFSLSFSLFLSFLSNIMLLNVMCANTINMTMLLLLACFNLSQSLLEIEVTFQWTSLKGFLVQ